MKLAHAGALGIAVAAVAALTVVGRRAPTAAPAATSVPVDMLITAEAHKGTALPVLQQQDVQAYEGNTSLPVTSFAPAAGGPLQLAILVDDSCDAGLALRYPELKAFMEQQPPSTAIAVGYMRNGDVHMAQTFTSDHKLDSQALRIPLGQLGITPSPYVSVSSLIREWVAGDAPGTRVRREILVFTDGVDLLGDWNMDDAGALQPGPPGRPATAEAGRGFAPAPPISDASLWESPYLDTAIKDAQQAQIPVFAIYADAAGHAGHSQFRILNGQDELAALAELTGAESYFLGNGAALDFTPYLNDLAAKLNAQYEITVNLPAGSKAGFVTVRIRSELKGVDLLASDQVYRPAAPRG